MSTAQARMDALAALREFPLVYRAIVSLPDALCLPEHPLAERIVFFEAQPPRGNPEILEELLRSVWHIDTTNWVRDGLIYNVYAAVDLIRERVEDGVPHAHSLFDIGGGGPPNPRLVDGVLYARADVVDLFVRPQTHAALLRVIREIDARYAAAATGTP